MCKWGTVVKTELHGKKVGIDACIYDLVMALNAGGMKTIASCCGHGKRPGNIILEDGRELNIASDFDEARRIDDILNQNGYQPIN